MAQHDFVIDNGPGLAVRTDINAAIQAVVTCSSGAVEPATKYAFQLWMDTATGILKQRNGTNTAWVGMQLTSPGTAQIVSATSPGTVYLRPNGAAATAGQTYVNSNGDLFVDRNVTASGFVQSAQYFVAASTSTIIGPASGGTAVYLRPVSYTDGTVQAFVNASGNFTITGPVGTKSTGTTWANPSDVRLKNVHGAYEHGLDELLQVQPVRFDYKANPELGECIGVIAQDVETVFPEAVTLTEGEIDGETVNDLRQFDCSPLIFALINAVKTLSDRVTALETAGVK